MKDLLPGSFIHNASFLHYHDPVGHIGRHANVVRHHDDSRIAAVTQLQHLTDNLGLRGDVQSAGRLIQMCIRDRPTERATSPLERYVMTLEEVPPGQVPTRMTPIASSGLRLKTFVRTKARSGITVNCAMQPLSLIHI